MFRLFVANHADSSHTLKTTFFALLELNYVLFRPITPKGFFFTSFALKRGFLMFVPNHANFSFISLKTLLRLLAVEFRCFFLALLHRKQKRGFQKDKAKISMISCQYAKSLFSVR